MQMLRWVVIVLFPCYSSLLHLPLSAAMYLVLHAHIKLLPKLLWARWLLLPSGFLRCVCTALQQVHKASISVWLVRLTQCGIWRPR